MHTINRLLCGTLIIFITAAVDLKNRRLEGILKYHRSIPDPLPKGSCLIVKLSVYKNDKAESKVITKHIIYNPKKGSPAKYSMEFPDTDISEDDLYNLVVSAILNVGWCSDDKKILETKIVQDQDFHTVTLIGVLPDKVIPTADIVVEGPDIALEPVSYTNPKALLKNAKLKDGQLLATTPSTLVNKTTLNELNTTKRTTTSRRLNVNTTKTATKSTTKSTTTVHVVRSTPFKPTGSITLAKKITRMKLSCPAPCADECFYAGCAAACCYAMALSLQLGQQAPCTNSGCNTQDFYQTLCSGHTCQENPSQQNQVTALVSMERSSTYPCTGTSCTQSASIQHCSGSSCNYQAQRLQSSRQYPCTGIGCLSHSYQASQQCNPTCYANCAPYCQTQCCQGYGRK